ncbi:hypothetical protein LDENG_00167040 [Lucifuga dentata]|nr:hypothetical protein LDENG_00167040 [Lucifuga dentata]
MGKMFKRHNTEKVQILQSEFYKYEKIITFILLKGPYHPFCMFEPDIFNFHTCYVTDNHFPKDKTIFQLY